MGAGESQFSPVIPADLAPNLFVKEEKRKMSNGNIYERLYGETLYGSGAGPQDRAKLFLDWIASNIPNEALILELGAGRGILARGLIAGLYRYVGTELCDCLIERDLSGLTIVKAHASDLSDLWKDGHFDVTVASDVLEHLEDEKAVREAFWQLVRLSKKWVLISVGLSASIATELGEPVNLHPVIRSFDWWKELYRTHCEIMHEGKIRKSGIIFGRKKP